MKFWKQTAFATSSAIALAGTAVAFTGGEMTEKFDSWERGMYAAGMIDMAAYQMAVHGNQDRGQCVIDWYYDDPGKHLSRFEQAYERFPDREAEVIVTALINRACPKE